MPNSYTALVIGHSKKGQLRTVYTRLKRYVETLRPAGDCEHGECIPGGANSNIRRYHQSSKSARDSYTRHGERPRFAFKGRWNRYGLFEFTPDGKERFAYWKCRRLFRREQCVCFTKRALKVVGFEDTYIEPF
jgi:hypothetical protein